MLRSETHGRPVRVSFNKTTIRSLKFYFILAFVDDSGIMQQCVLKLAMYKEVPKELLTNQMSDHIIYDMEGTLQAPRNLIKVFTRDCVSLNQLTELVVM